MNWDWIVLKASETNNNVFDEVVREHINEKPDAHLKLLIKPWILAINHNYERVHITYCFKADNNIVNVVWIDMSWIPYAGCIY